MILVQIATVVGLLGSLGIQGAPTATEQQKQRIIEKFKDIENECTRILEIHKSKKNTHQIVCIMEMSEEELLSEVFPAKPEIKHFMNQKVRNFSETGKIIQSLHRRMKVHGEIIALRLNDSISGLNRAYTDTSMEESRKPYVFIYSYFLPCAGLKDIPFSCAEELAKQALLTKDNFNMLVGYSDRFNYTVKDLALGYLHHDSIYALVNITERKCEIRSEDSFFTPQVDIFQEKFHGCILQRIESISCQICKTGETTRTTIRKKIDALIQRCIRKQTSEPRGPLTYLDMRMLQTCFKDEEWFNVCSHDSTSQTQPVDECYTEVMKNAYKDKTTILVLGQPSDTEPFWMENENLSIEWAKLYPNDNEQESQSNGKKRTRSRSRSGENIKRQKSNETKGC